MAGNIANVVETYDAGFFNSDQPYGIIEQLSNFERASAVASQYQFYRCVKIKVEWQPRANLFQRASISGASVFSVPQMYRVMNRNGSFPQVFDEQYLLTQGADPHQFTRDIEVSYIPNTLTVVGNQDTTLGLPPQGSSIRKNAWIASYLAGANIGGNIVPPQLNDKVNYYGLLYYMFQQDVGTSTPNVVGSVKITAHWQFKQPTSPTVSAKAGTKPSILHSKVSVE